MYKGFNSFNDFIFAKIAELEAQADQLCKEGADQSTIDEIMFNISILQQQIDFDF